MAVTTSDGLWVVPPSRAVWIPANTIHSIQMWGAFTMKTLYFKPRLVRSLGRQCCLINVSPLLRELLLEACRVAPLRGKNRSHARMIDVIVDQLQASPFVPLQLPMPSDERATKLAALLLADSSDERPLGALCGKCGASKRTMERLFRQETGFSLGRWRRQASLARAAQLLAFGCKVTSVALELGYRSPSAFIAMFKRTLGTTPAKYLES